MPLSEFGHGGAMVTRVGLGGEGILRTWGRGLEAQAVIREALAQGIGYFDCARVYAGSEGYYGSVWSREPGLRRGVFQASKSAARDGDGAMADLEKTLATLAVDHLDLWQIHDVRTEADLRAIEGPGGALEAFLAAKARGRTRYIGVTGHHDPAVLLRAVREWPVDSVMMPVNPVEGALGGFLDAVLPLARERGMAVIAMKTLGASRYVQPRAGVTAERLLRYALSQDVTAAIVGCADPQEVRTLAQVARVLEPMPAPEQAALVGLFAPLAMSLAHYRAKR
jgi:aryl-alcohol dehydrogenase-like predicted oxidoreductase